jgi:hypothetical protein
MKWKSHTAIARAIAAEMNLPDELERAFCAGSIEPDKKPDLAYRVSKGGRTYIGRAPHHMPPTGTIMAYAWRARKAYLEGNDYWAVKSLGRALHYVQDKCVHTGFRMWRHDARESDIADLTPPRKAVCEGIEMARCSPRFVRECIVTVRPRRDPRKAMYDATLYSSAIFASVIGPVDAEERFNTDYERAVRGHRCRYAIATALIAASGAAAYMLDEPLIMVPGTMAAVAAVKIDPAFRRAMDEAEWFGKESKRPWSSRPDQGMAPGSGGMGSW